MSSPTITHIHLIYSHFLTHCTSNNLGVYLEILAQIYQNLHSHTRSTKRDVFYKSPTLFQSQRAVDVAVDDWAATFNVPRSVVGIVAGSKGLVSGAEIHLVSGEVSGCCTGRGTVLIPLNEDVSSVDIGDGVAFVVVIEKEATFQDIVRNCPEEVLGRCVLITVC